jgi:Arc/MetJ-type ribon-helix-helix transcriptional regulator
MTIHLPPDIESSIQAAVHSGHFASLDAAMTEAASLLLQRLKQPPAASPVAAATHKPIWEEILELGSLLGTEKIARQGLGSSALIGRRS